MQQDRTCRLKSSWHAWLVFFALSISALAQNATLRGIVTDESGALVPGATVTVKGAEGLLKTATTGNDGSYSFTGLAAGSYTVQAAAPDLVLPKEIAITLRGGTQTLGLQLKVASTTQQVTVQDRAGPAVSTDASNNASAIVLRGADLDALSDNPDDLQADLLALAGPAAGPNGGQIFIDGFSGGQLPAKESIREIRINQNPFSPEFDKLGFGRIEIFTKPGSEKFHTTVGYNFANDFWNSRNPYAAEKAPFSLHELRGNLSGPLGKRASFFLDMERELIDNGSIVNGAILDSQTLSVIDPYTEVVTAQQRRITVSPRVDYQLNPSNTLTMRYRFNRDGIEGAGVGSFNLASRGYHSIYTNQTAQITETAVLGTAVVNETRFQFFRSVVETIPDNAAAALQVLGAFNGGGAQTGHSFDRQNNYEFQNNTSIAHRAHFFRFGVRLRAQAYDSVSPRNFGGTYTFAGGLAPQLDSANQIVRDASGNPVLVTLRSIERYRRTLLFQRLGFSASQIRTLGGGATQFSINAGRPDLDASQVDLGVFAGDDWRVRPNLTLNLGFRYETQTNIHDWRAFAPRIGLAWAPGGNAAGRRPKTVIRAGFGMFYDRFPLASTLTARRYNGIVQQQYVTSDPAILNLFPSIPSAAALAPFQSSQTIQQVSSDLRAPYIMQSALSVERQLPANTTIALTYANSHGLHIFRSTDINAPLLGTYNPNVVGSGVFPFRTPGPIFLMESSGRYNQNQFIVNVNAKVNQDVSLFGSYMLNRALSDSDGLGTTPANPYNYAGEYGPASTDVRNRMTFGGSITKWNVRISPLLSMDSGSPFDITTGGDLYGTTLFNARPGIATDPRKPGVIQTQYGLLDPNPALDQKLVSRNFGRGPGQIRFNVRISKTFGFGTSREAARAAANSAGATVPVGGGSDRGRGVNVFGVGGGPQNTNAGPTSRRFNLTVSMSALNVINHNNPGPIIGNITSPLFGRANQPAGGTGGGGFSEGANNRRLELQTRLTF